MRKKIDLSHNFSAKTRTKKEVKFIIFHYTGMQSQIESIKRLKDKKSQVSCHYLISRRGKIIQMVKENFIAWHAGKSKWKNFNNLNKSSIGIELVNKGHMYGYENFTNFQIKSLIKLCRALKKKFKIKTQNFLGHSDIAPLRKIDPGEKFPWERLSRYKFGRWYKFHKISFTKNEKIMKKLFFKNIFKIGYRYFHLSKRTHKDRHVIKAFQRRYSPSKITGKIDKKLLKISHFLANN
tara:strand:- start:147 stop:857 length:711 start_codon:yes stop_codon:yes gene_type:complete